MMYYAVHRVYAFPTTHRILSSTHPFRQPQDVPEAHNIAHEVDHYAVLGVSTDATDKQLKTAYRMRRYEMRY
jgi:hypothetical protein